MKQWGGRKFFHIYSKLRTIFYKHYNKLYFRMCGIEYGSNLKVRNKLYIIGNGIIKVGNNFTYSSGDNINSVSRNIRGSMHVMRNNAEIIIGDNVGISASCIRAMENIIIGDNVQIGADCLIMDNDAHPHDFMKRRREFETSMAREDYIKLIPKAPIKIDDDVWVGARCQILKGVHIGARSIIAAGSVVTKDIPSDVIAGGNPCKIIRFLT